MIRVRLVLRSALVIWLAFAGWAAAQTQTAVEYYYAAWNYYFVTAFPDEIAVLDAGVFGGVWKRTGQTFEVWTGPTNGALPTCRFFTITFAPKSSHFYTPYAAECEGLKSNPNWQFESIAFYLQLPDANGDCPPGTVILYRLYNNGMGGAPNHRFTTTFGTFNQMLAAGWTFEGDLRTFAFACVPAYTPPGRTTAEGFWDGNTSTGSLVSGVVLDTGAYYFYYSTYTAGTGITPIALLQGTANSNNGTFQSFDGTYSPLVTLSGNFAERGTVTAFNATYNPSYDLPVNLAAVAGVYNGNVFS